MPDPTRTAIGTWSGGRFMHFGEPLDDERMLALLRPDERLRTVITADAYGAGEADALLGRALDGRRARRATASSARSATTSTRASARARRASRASPTRGCAARTATRDYLRMATERSLERIGADAFDLLLLHNPDRTGYTSPAVWDGMAALRDAGLTRRLGVAPGPANGFTLDLLDCFERFGALIDWAMVILNPLEPWPGELVLDAAAPPRRAADHARRRLRRAVPRRRAARATRSRSYDHRGFRPDGWVERGRAQARARCARSPSATGSRCSSSPASGTSRTPPVRCVAPTLIQEPGAGAQAGRGQARGARRAARPPTC